MKFTSLKNSHYLTALLLLSIPYVAANELTAGTHEGHIAVPSGKNVEAELLTIIRKFLDLNHEPTKHFYDFSDELMQVLDAHQQEKKKFLKFYTTLADIRKNPACRNNAKLIAIKLKQLDPKAMPKDVLTELTRRQKELLDILTRRVGPSAKL